MALISLAIVFAPGMSGLAQLLIVLTLVLTGSTAGAGLNFTLANDLTRNPRDVPRIIAITAFGGNLFGLIAPIITGYVIAATGGYVWAFRIAALLLACGALITLAMTRAPIAGEHEAAPQPVHA
jgi:ACS family glucarate transporter-like MFS transporter